MGANSMEHTLSRKLTPALRTEANRPARSIWQAVLILLFNGLLAGWLLIHPGNPEIVVAVDDLLQVAGPLLALVMCFHGLGVWRGRPGPDRTSSVWATRFLAIGVLGFVVGQGIWAYDEQIAHRPVPLPSWSDAGYLSVYPFLLLGILLLSSRPLSSAIRARVAVDGLLIMTMLVTFSWCFILGPTVMQGEGSLLQKAVGLAYPLGDLVLVASVLVL